MCHRGETILGLVRELSRLNSELEADKMLVLERQRGALNLFGAPQRLQKAIKVSIPC